jgi:hypothetical protein
MRWRDVSHSLHFSKLQTASQTLQHGRESFERKAWAESYRLLQAAEREVPLEPEDLERLAMAAYLTGRDAEHIVDHIVSTRPQQYGIRADPVSLR